ncbi:unnamed protein product [Enterobius vermicularis]|uniref:Uncharacterized protein n=1 Tax=Enterobius vermicularis TaxID=51028 RepID=A0A0N4VGF0_ENTVE|nr:unnamed protein product [Enterobius vermicularis]
MYNRLLIMQMWLQNMILLPSYQNPIIHLS